LRITTTISLSEEVFVNLRDLARSINLFAIINIHEKIENIEVKLGGNELDDQDFEHFELLAEYLIGALKFNQKSYKESKKNEMKDNLNLGKPPNPISYPVND
jgi:hypothetical protein